MGLAQDLIGQAEFLARREPKRPKQASLRRAVSSAYYGLFHFLVDEACRLILSGKPDHRPLREQLARGFDHSRMKSASNAFANAERNQELTHGPADRTVPGAGPGPGRRNPAPDPAPAPAADRTPTSTTPARPLPPSRDPRARRKTLHSPP